MIQVKEIINYQEGQEAEINKWLEEMDGKIEIVDIKYSVAALPPDVEYGWHTQEMSGTLIVYKTIENKKATKETDQSIPR